MPFIAEHLGLNPRNITFEDHAVLPGVGAVGIEIELENIGGNGRWPTVEGWVRKDDGSLRNGKEYIFDGPQSGGTALASIQNMARVMGETGVDPTFRCSTHIHLDVRDMDWNQYERLVLLYMVFEDVFFDHCQPYRRQSNFCIPFQNNDWLSNNFGRRVLSTQEAARKFHGVSQWPKYSGLNLQVTGSFGSVEFRGSHAITDEVELTQLAQRMLYLKKFAMEDKSEDHFKFINKLVEVGANQVFPVGLRDGYVMEPGAKEQGLSTATHALIVSAMTRTNEPVMDFGMRPDPNRVQRDLVRQALAYRGVWRREALLGLNIQVPQGNASLMNAINMMVALNKLDGINVTLRQIVDLPNIDSLITVRQNLDVFHQHYGHNAEATLANLQ